MSDSAPPAVWKGSGSDRREPILAVLGCVAAAGVLLLALDQAWLRVDLTARAPLPSSSQTFTGHDVRGDPLVAFAVIFAAAGLALIPARRVARLLVGAVMVGTGLTVVAVIWFYLADGGAGAADYLTRGRKDPTASMPPMDPELFALPALLGLLAGGIAVAVGIFTIVRCSRWPVMGARYARRAGSGTDDSSMTSVATGPARQTDPAPAVSEAAMWSALERGEDPTLTAPDPDVQHPAQPPDQPVAGR